MKSQIRLILPQLFFLFCSFGFAEPTISEFKARFEQVSGPYSEKDFTPSQQRAGYFKTANLDQLWPELAANAANSAKLVKSGAMTIEDYLALVVKHRRFIGGQRDGISAGVLRGTSDRFNRVKQPNMEFGYLLPYATHLNTERYWEYEERFVREYLVGEMYDVKKSYVYKDLNGNLLDAGHLSVFRSKPIQSVTISHGDPLPILDDVLNRFERLKDGRFKGSFEEKQKEFFYALYGFYIAVPYRLGSAAIGKMFSAGIYRVIFGKKMPPLPDGVDLEAMLSESPEKFIERMSNYSPTPDPFHQLKPPGHKWYKLAPMTSDFIVEGKSLKPDKSSLLFWVKYQDVRFSIDFVKSMDTIKVELPPNHTVNLPAPDLLKIILALGVQAVIALDGENLTFDMTRSSTLKYQTNEILKFAVKNDWGQTFTDDQKAGEIFISKTDAEYYRNHYFPFLLHESKRKKTVTKPADSSVKSCLGLF